MNFEVALDLLIATAITCLRHDNRKLRRGVEIAINYRELFPTTPPAISRAATRSHHSKLAHGHHLHATEHHEHASKMHVENTIDSEQAAPRGVAHLVILRGASTRFASSTSCACRAERL